MKNKIAMLVIVSVILLITVVGFTMLSGKQTVQNKPQKFIPQNVTEERHAENFSSIKMVNEKGQPLIFQNDTLFFQIMSLQNQDKIEYSIIPKDEYFGLYQKLRYNSSMNTVFVYPIFTQAAYDHNGFYDYYSGNCDERCLSIPLQYTIGGSGTTSSMIGTSVLVFLGYPYITDIDIDKNPDILKKYDRVIMLHSEYVTQKEFDAITQHPNVFYLYPNSLYARVQTNYNNNTLTLVRGHGYPDASIKNGFDWKFDNSQFEYDSRCDNWSITTIDNGKMLDCYPGFRMLYDKNLLMTIHG
ncbi:MAG TPA: hypothetical protein VG896_00030 [Candidatus Nitrosotalea sp.]|nr:hypothetical protein [Candidatus Nitrosotalea sp.]